MYPNLVISLQSKQYAYDLCKDIDLKDIAYLALSIELQVPLISRDEALLNGLRKKGFRNIVSFTNFIDTK